MCIRDRVSGAFLAATSLAAGSGSCGPAGPARQVAGVDLDAEQLANAGLITDVTYRGGLPARAAVIAVATALQESRLRRLDSCRAVATAMTAARTRVACSS